jgi:hypothetical protein
LSEAVVLVVVGVTQTLRWLDQIHNLHQFVHQVVVEAKETILIPAGLLTVGLVAAVVA